MEKIELIIVVINDNEHIGRIDIAADASVTKLAAELTRFMRPLCF